MNFAYYFTNYGHIWLIELAICFGIILLINFRWKAVMKFITTFIIPCTILVWAAGTVVYSIGFAYDGSGKSLTAFSLRAMLSSIGMFLTKNDFNQISPAARASVVYMVAFSVTHMCAMMLSTIFLLNTVGFKIKSNLALFFEAKSAKKHDRETYIFWKVTPKTIALASDIKKECPQARIIFINPKQISNESEKLDFTSMVKNSFGQNDKDIAEEIACIDSALVLHTSMSGRSEFKLNRILGIIRNSSIVNYYFFDEDSELNLTLGSFIFFDKAGVGYKPTQTIGIWTGAKFNGRQRAMEQKALLDKENRPNFNWNFMNISAVAVASLKFNGNNHPINTFSPESINNGKIDGSFEALVIGCGKSGREMFKYFYEFGSFVGQNGKAAPKEITLVDKKAESRLNELRCICPGVMNSQSVKIVDMTTGSNEFWDLFKTKVNSLNAIGLCLGDDELSVNTTVDIYRNILKYRKNKEKRIKIFLRVYSPEYEAISNSIAEEYTKDSALTGIEVISFGGISQTFCKKVIHYENLLETYAEFNYRFDIIRGRNVNLTPMEALKKDFSISKYLDKYKVAAIAQDELDRRFEQCISETFHAKTIKALAGNSKSIDELPEDLREALSQTAYLREKASHELLGYSAGDEENAEKKITPYVKNWEDCNEKARNVAAAIAKASLEIN